MKEIFLLLFFAFSLISCNTELDRVDLLKENFKEVTFELNSDDVVELYADIEIEFKEKPLFVYHCEFRQDGLLLFDGGTDPLEIEFKEKESKIITKEGITHLKIYGKLDGNLKATQRGIYSIKTSFLKNDDADLNIKKVEIVFVK